MFLNAAGAIKGGGQGYRQEGRKEGREEEAGRRVAALFVLQGGERGQEGRELFCSPSIWQLRVNGH